MFLQMIRYSRIGYKRLMEGGYEIIGTTHDSERALAAALKEASEVRTL